MQISKAAKVKGRCVPKPIWNFFSQGCRRFRVIYSDRGREGELAMSELARKLCDELLGADRNKPLHLKGTGGVKFHDHDVSFILVDYDLIH